MRQFALIVIASFSFFASHSQLILDNTQTTESLIQQLVGNNVSVSNVTLNGLPANFLTSNIAGFQCNDCNIGVESGLLLSTGLAANAVGPNDDQSTSSQLFALNYDADLQQLVSLTSTNPIYDVTVIELDFIAITDSLIMNYVWASEEYDTWSNSGYNDAVGIFVSGPGILGPFSLNAMNIATIPGTDGIPVSVNNINNGVGNAGPCMNCEYFNQDSDSDLSYPLWPINAGAEWNINPHFIEYDGYTDIMTARAPLQCGQTYHLKIAICDTRDQILDSGIFIRSDSFGAASEIQANLESSAPGPDGATLFETCGEGILHLSRPSASSIDEELVVAVNFSGDAINGVDLTLVPDSFVFNIGQSEIEFNLDAFDDGIEEGSEQISLTFSYILDCIGDTITSTLEFHLEDLAQPISITPQNFEVCSGEIIFLEPEIVGGYGNYTFTWETGDTSAYIIYSTEVSHELTLSVTDACGTVPTIQTFQVNIFELAPLTADIVYSYNFPLTCPDGSNTFGAYYEGGLEPVYHSWTDSDGNSLFESGFGLEVSTYNAGWIYLTATDACGTNAVDSILVTVFAPAFYLEAPDTIWNTCSDSVLVSVTPVGGYPGGNYYSWQVDGAYVFDEFSNEILVANDDTTYVTLTAYDNCSQQSIAEIVVIRETAMPAISLEDTISLDCGESITIQPTYSGGTGSPNLWSYQWTQNGTIVSYDPTLFAFETGEVYLEITDLCGTSVLDSVAIQSNIPVLNIELGENAVLNCNDSIVLLPQITNAAGDLSYQWFADGQLVSEDSIYTTPIGFEGIVAVTVITSCNQLMSDSINIQTLHLESFTPILTQPLCFNENVGCIDFSAFDYLIDSIAWQNGLSGLSNCNLPPGSYEISVIDTAGCIGDYQFEIISSNPIEFNFLPATLCPLETISLEFLSNSAIDSLTIDWQGADPSALYAGVYPITITNQFGCSLETSIILPGYESFSIVPIVTPSSGTNDGSIAVVVNGGQPPFEYLWNDSSTDSAIAGLNGGIYTVMVTDAHGCAQSLDVLLTVGIDESDLITHLFPVPFNDHLTIQNVTSSPIQIYDQMGQLVFENGSVSSLININTASWASGIYLVKTSSGAHKILKAQ